MFAYELSNLCIEVTLLSHWIDHFYFSNLFLTEIVHSPRRNTFPSENTREFNCLTCNSIMILKQDTTIADLTTNNAVIHLLKIAISKQYCETWSIGASESCTSDHSIIYNCNAIYVTSHNSMLQSITKVINTQLSHIAAKNSDKVSLILFNSCTPDYLIINKMGEPRWHSQHLKQKMKV